MDVCDDIEAVEARVLPYLRPPADPVVLRHSQEQCIDGQPGLSETLADRARRCLAADPYDPDAARLLGLLGAEDDVPLLVPGALRGLWEGREAIGRLGGPLADDVTAWWACIRGGWPNPTMRRGPTPSERGRYPTADERAAWREGLRNGSDVHTFGDGPGMLGLILDPADRALLEELAERPWLQGGWAARTWLYASVENEWPVPERWVSWAREDLAHGVEAAAPVIARVDGRPAAVAAGARFETVHGCCWTDDGVPGPVETAALLAAPRPQFPPPAERPSRAGEVRERALVLLEEDPFEGLYLLSFVAERKDLEVFRDRLYGPDAVDAAAALARWRTEPAVELLVEAARGPEMVPAMSALAASRTDRGWTAALASWKGRTALTQTGTVEGCGVALVVWDSGLGAYEAPACLADPVLRERIVAAASRGANGAQSAIHGSAEATWASWEPSYDPDPAVRAAHLDALLADVDPSDDVLRGVPKSPSALAFVTARTAGRPELEDRMAGALLPIGGDTGTEAQRALARRLRDDPTAGANQRLAENFIARVEPRVERSGLPPRGQALDQVVAELDYWELDSALRAAPERIEDLLASAATLTDERKRRLALTRIIAELPEPRGSSEVAAALASGDPERLRVAAGVLHGKRRPVDTAPLASWCMAPTTTDEDRAAVAVALFWQGRDEDLATCLRTAIREAKAEDLIGWASRAEQGMRVLAAWEALADRAPGAPEAVRAELTSTFLRVGLTADGRPPR